MSRFLRLLVLVIPFSFLMGAYWGFKNIREMQERPPSKGEVRLLTQKGLFPQSVRDWIFEKHKIRVNVTALPTDVALLEMIQTAGRDFDVIIFPSYFSQNLVYDEIFQSLNNHLLTARKNISVDFLNLEYDTSNTYLLPLTWGVNGVIFNKESVKKPTYSMKSLLTDKDIKAKVSLLPSSIQLLNTAKLIFPVIDGWINNEDLEPLVRTLGQLKPLIQGDRKTAQRSLRDGTVLYQQTTNGRAATLIDDKGRFEFFVPDEKSILWLNLVGVSRFSFQADLAHDFINLLFKPETSQTLVQDTAQATTVKALDNSGLHTMRKAAYLRKLRLSQILLPTEHSAYKPIWTKSLERALPKIFKTPE